MNCKKLFYSLIGQWHIERKLSLHPLAYGKVNFNLIKSNCIMYEEKMMIKTSKNISYQANQTYFYIYDELSDSITKKFKDDQLFYELNFINNTEATGYHKCLNDHYKALYNFISHNEFKLSYKVTGPGKDFVISSFHNKITNN